MKQHALDCVKQHVPLHKSSFLDCVSLLLSGWFLYFCVDSADCYQFMCLTASMGCQNEKRKLWSMYWKPSNSCKFQTLLLRWWCRLTAWQQSDTALFSFLCFLNHCAGNEKLFACLICYDLVGMWRCMHVWYVKISAFYFGLECEAFCMCCMLSFSLDVLAFVLMMKLLHFLCTLFAVCAWVGWLLL